MERLDKNFEELLYNAQYKVETELERTQKYQENASNIQETLNEIKDLFAKYDGNLRLLDSLLSKYQYLVRMKNEQIKNNLYMQGFFDCVYVLNKYGIISELKKSNRV